jgi:hypothetical protein
MRRELSRRRHQLQLAKRRVAVFVLVVFGVGSGPIIAENRRIHAIDVIAIWFLICTSLALWSYLSARRDLARRVNRFEEALRRNEAIEVRVQSTKMVEFEEEEDEGACYAFQLDGGRVLFVAGQSYYSSARFPNTDFSLVGLYDKDGGCLDELIEKRGRKLLPLRVIPAELKKKMFIPEHLHTVEGNLADVERLLTTAHFNL